MFHGHVSDEDLAQKFAECDCFCLPSIERTESFGLVLLEAMYSGKATVIADVPGSGMGWIVDHQETGLKVPPANPGQLAAALRYLQGNHDRMIQLGRNGRSKFDQQFHIDRCTAGIVELYHRLVDVS